MEPPSSVISDKMRLSARRQDASSDALSPPQSHAKAFHVEAEEVQTCLLGVRLRGLLACLPNPQSWLAQRVLIYYE